MLNNVDGAAYFLHIRREKIPLWRTFAQLLQERARRLAQIKLYAFCHVRSLKATP